MINIVGVLYGRLQVFLNLRLNQFFRAQERENKVNF